MKPDGMFRWKGIAMPSAVPMAARPARSQKAAAVLAGFAAEHEPIRAIGIVGIEFEEIRLTHAFTMFHNPFPPEFDFIQVIDSAGCSQFIALLAQFNSVKHTTVGSTVSCRL